MARRKRDYKAEWAARKRRATAAGYRSVGEYSQARKKLGTPRNASPLPKRVTERVTKTDGVIRRESKAWSDKHSRQSSSRYRASWDDEKVGRYYDTFVADWHSAKSKRRAITEWVRRGQFYSSTEYESLYPDGVRSSQ